MTAPTLTTRSALMSFLIRYPEAVGISIDPGQKSGAALVIQRRAGFVFQVVFAETVKDDPSAYNAVAERARAVATAEGLPLMAIVERAPPGMGKRFSARTRDGMAQRAGAWVSALRAHGKVPQSQILRVYPAQWRKPVLGIGMGETRFMKALAQTYVRSRYKLLELGDDAAEALVQATYLLRHRPIELALEQAAKEAAS